MKKRHGFIVAAMAVLLLVLTLAGCDKTPPPSSSSVPEEPSEPPGEDGTAEILRWTEYPLPPGVKKANLTGLPEERANMELFFFGEEVMVILLPAPPGAGTGAQVWLYDIPGDRLVAHTALEGYYETYTAEIKDGYFSLIRHDYIQLKQPVRQSEEFRLYPDGRYESHPSRPLDRVYSPDGTKFVKVGTFGVELGEAGSDETVLIIPDGELPEYFESFISSGETEEELHSNYFPHRISFWINNETFAYYEVGYEWLEGSFLYDAELGRTLDLPGLEEFIPGGITTDGRYVFFQEGGIYEGDRVPQRLFLDPEDPGFSLLPETPALLALLPAGSGWSVEAEIEALSNWLEDGAPEPMPHFLRFYAGGALLKEYPHLPLSTLYRVSDRLLVLGPEDGYNYDTFDVNLDSVLLVEVPVL